MRPLAADGEQSCRAAKSALAGSAGPQAARPSSKALIPGEEGTDRESCDHPVGNAGVPPF